MTMHTAKLKEWLSVTSIGDKIKDTPFVPFKVPLHLVSNISPSQQFLFDNVLSKHPNIGLVIDLTPAVKYYKPQELERFAVEYLKIPCNGRGEIPSQKHITTFFQTVDDYLSRYPNRLIGVHCFHGLNRTGFMICLYMVKKLKFSALTAVTAFEKARKANIVRRNYVHHLQEVERSTKRHERPRRKDIDKKDRDRSRSHHRHELNRWKHSQMEASRPHRKDSVRNVRSNGPNQYSRHSRSESNDRRANDRAPFLNEGPRSSRRLSENWRYTSWSRFSDQFSRPNPGSSRNWQENSWSSFSNKFSRYNEELSESRNRNYPYRQPSNSQSSRTR